MEDMEDLFEKLATSPDLFPKKLVKIVKKMAKSELKGELNAERLLNYQSKVQEIGYDFEFGLDCVPYDLIKKE